MVAESLRRGEGTGTVGSGKQRGRLSGMRRRGSKRPSACGVVSDGAVPSSLAGEQGKLSRDVEEGVVQGETENGKGKGNDGREVVSGEGSVEGKKGKLMAMSESLGELAGRRRGMKSGSSSSNDGSPVPSARRDEGNGGNEPAG